MTTEIREAHERGEVELEESLFADPGDDYSALIVNNRQIAFWPGY